MHPYRHKVRVEQVICEGTGHSSADRVVKREFSLPFVPVAGMILVEGDWESGEIKQVVARAEAGFTWTIICYPEEDRRRRFGRAHEQTQSVEQIVAEYLENGWESP